MALEVPHASLVTKLDPNGAITGYRLTDRFGVLGTDMSVFWKHHHDNYVHSAHGDSFDTVTPPGGIGWRSPVSFRTSRRPADGIWWDNAVGGARAKQVLNYAHMAEPAPRDQAQTHIPCWGLGLENNDTVLTTFGTRRWFRDGDSQADQARGWETNHVAMWVSRDYHAENYDSAPIIRFYNDHPVYRLFQNQAAVKLDDGYVYVFGTRGGRKSYNDPADGKIYLMRHHWTWMSNEAGWEYWSYTNGSWSWGRNYPTPILSAENPSAPQTLGELSAQVIDGKIVLMYTDYSIGATVMRVANRPDAAWSVPQVSVTASEQPRHYAPGIHPWSTLLDVHFGLSQWQADWYGVKQLHQPAYVGIGSTGSTGSVGLAALQSTVANSALEDTPLAQMYASVDEDGLPTELPDGPARPLTEGLSDADRAAVLSDLSAGSVETGAILESLVAAREGRTITPKPQQLLEFTEE